MDKLIAIDLLKILLYKASKCHYHQVVLHNFLQATSVQIFGLKDLRFIDVVASVSLCKLEDHQKLFKSFKLVKLVKLVKFIAIDLLKILLYKAYKCHQVVLHNFLYATFLEKLWIFGSVLLCISNLFATFYAQYFDNFSFRALVETLSKSKSLD